MSIPPRGTPASYTDSSGNVYGGFVASDNGVNPEIAYYGSSGMAITGPLSTRDDTTATLNSYAIVQIDSKFKGT